MLKNAINCKKKFMLRTALLMTPEATLHKREKWCQNLHSTEKRWGLTEKQEAEMDDFIKGSMKFEEQLYLGEINHEPLKVLNPRN